MPQRPIVPAVAIAALAIFTVWITWRAKSLEIDAGRQTSTSSMMGKQAPDFQLSNLNGQTVSLSDFKGRKVVIGFWASWCGPCRVEMPMLVKFYRTTHKEDSKFEILAISTDTDPSAAELAAHHDKMPFPVLMDSSQKTAKAYQVEAIPTLLLVNEQGKVEWSQIGSQSSTDILLAGQLGIKNYTPQFGAQANAAGH